MKTSWRTLLCDKNVTKPWKIPPLSSFRNPVPWNLSHNHFPRCRRILLPLLLYVKRLWHNRHLINISVKKLFVRIQNVYGINMHQLSQNLLKIYRSAAPFPNKNPTSAPSKAYATELKRQELSAGMTWRSTFSGAPGCSKYQNLDTGIRHHLLFPSNLPRSLALEKGQ